MKKRFLMWLAVAFLAVSLSGCGGKSSSQSMAVADREVSVQFNQSTGNGEMDKKSDNGGLGTAVPSTAAPDEIQTDEVQSTALNGQSPAGNISTGQKVIFTGQVDYQTLDFDKTQTDLCSYMSSIGAYQQSSSVRGGGIGYEGLKSAIYVFRVPKTRYDQAFTDLRKFGTVVFEQSTGEDVTDKYFDSEARLKSLQIQRDRLMTLLEKAAKMEDILKIEKELQTTNYDIENLTGTLKKWDSLVEYSTLSVNINEVEQIQKVAVKGNDGFFYRVASGFKNSVTGLWKFLQDLMVLFAAALPVIIPIGAIGYIIYRIARKRMRKPVKAPPAVETEQAEPGEKK